MYIKKIEIKNLRCFSDFSLEFNTEVEPIPWTIITGDNGTGKSVLLKSIALGLCDESGAAALLRESEVGYVRREKDSAKILIQIVDPKNKNDVHQITTFIEVVRKGNVTFERLRQRHSKNFPWHKIFICGYGAGRGSAGSGDIAGYSVINAVYNMFNYVEGLQNPELTIRRFEQINKIDFFYILKNILNLEKKNKIGVSPSGLEIDGPWGVKMPLRDISDGYKTSFLWIMDFLGWALSKDPSLKKGEDIQGIVVIDEIEQHLHPSWQRTIVESLRKQFPKVQFLASTHSPLVASSAKGRLSEGFEDKLIHLKFNRETKSVESMNIEKIEGRRFDQVLASPAFDYITESIELEKILSFASNLSLKGSKRSASEERVYKELKQNLKELLITKGQTLIEREIELEKYENIKSQIKKLEKLIDSNDKY